MENNPYNPPAADGTKIHQWIYVMVPLNIKKREPIQFPDWEEPALIFSAFCKGCRNYFTEQVPIAEDGAGLISKSSLPRYGCVPISDEVLNNPASANFDSE